jgi:beta-galactosidase
MERVPRLGAAYYPEQWPRERWRIDAKLMAEAGLSFARLGEFAWARLEPRPGELDLDWLDEVVEILARAGLDVILGTPTAAPPTWLIEQHPEILPVRMDGRVQPFGNRRHYCPNRPAFRAATERIVGALADRFGDDERVSAWQIDNELGGRCYCDACRDAFHAWLRDRYESIEVVNDVWGTVFWSQTYGDWRQIPLPDGTPVPTGFGRNAPNPGLALDFRRFSSDSLIGYLRFQAAILRERCAPRQRITHNLMGFRFAEIDYHELAAELDVVSWDNYPSLDTSRRWSSPALAGDAMRGLKDAPVWVLEQQVGPLGWELIRSSRRGEMRLHTWQAIAHGAESICYFRWRTARFGTEQHWHGIVEANGRVGRRYAEVRALAAEVGVLGCALAGARPHADVAIVHDYDSRFALQVQPTNPALAYEETVQRHYEAVRGLGSGVDVVSTRADLSQYRAVVAPSLYVMDEATAATLAAYVAGGGLLVLAPRAGVKDRCNAVPERPLPAWLAELVGLEVVDYVSTAEDDGARIAGIGEFRGWYEELALRGARPVAEYADGEFAGTAAVAAHQVGRGRVVYIAGAATRETLTALYRPLWRDSGLAVHDLPDQVEAVPLRNGNGDLIFLLNHAGEERFVELGSREIALEPLGIALVEDVSAPTTEVSAAEDARI